MTKKKKQVYPAGWDEERIRKLAEHYDIKPRTNRLRSTKPLFAPKARRSWSCPLSWSRRLSSS